jgi:serine/threonine protein kinase/tetratricopeptide (TPR) repeat protein
VSRLEEERIFREDLVEKRPPLYVYKAKRAGKDCFLNEIIPYITTEKKAILDFLKTLKSFSENQYNDIANIVDCKKKGIRILVMEESIEGQNLEYLVNQNKPVKPEAAIVLIYSIAHAFQKFHALGVYGLGIEPKNIIIKDAKHISIIHPLFPIAERFFRKTDKPEILNPRYLSPEQIKENVFSEKGDLFTVGILLFELLNSIYPFSSGTYQLLDFRKYVPYCIKYITERVLAFDPEKRFNSFHDFLEELHVCKDELASAEKAVPIEQPPKEEKPREKERKKPKLKPPEAEKKIERKKEPPRKEEKPKPAVEKPKPKPKERPKPKLRKKRKFPKIKFTIPQKPLIIGAAVLLGLILLIVFIPRIIRMIKPYQVASLSVDRHYLRTLDEQGNEQWSFDAGADISFHRTVDIDGDGREEILVGTSTVITTESGVRKHLSSAARFYALNTNGRVLHRSEIGMASIYEEGSSPWLIYNVHLIDLNGDGRLDFIPLAITDDSLDCMLLSTPQKGMTISFWHAGVISLVSLHRAQDGSPVLICGGTNSRTGEKPVVFALDARSCNDQSPPWGGSMSERGGLLWYRFLRGGGTVSNILTQDDASLHVVTSQGRELSCRLDGLEIVETDTTEEMVMARTEQYNNVLDIFKRAMEAQKTNNIESMMSFLNEGLQLEQDLPAMKSIFHYIKGKQYSKEKQWKSASNAFSVAAATDGGYYGPLLELAEAYRERMQFKNAAAAFGKAYNLSGKESHYYRMIDAYVADAEYRKAKNALKRIEGKAKNAVLFLLATAQIAREEGDFPAAIRSYETILLREPQNLKVNILLADAYAELNKNIAAMDSLFQHISRKDSSLAFHHIETAAWICYRKSAFDEALHAIDQAIKRDEALSVTSVSARRRLPRIYYRKAIIAQPLGLKEEKEEAVRKARDSRFCKGYIKRQLDYLVGSP